ncbi:MAG: hypothetical protein J3K34DRAFT_449131 [Monoraphidium minutum]|nr:MAG: hypothetical protein J3K34DRAFT_449131 [Monoraphidium minutum]
MRRDAAAALPPSATAQADPRQDPRAHPKDHIIRTHGRDAAGDAAFIGLNLALWGVDAALFRASWLPGSPDALPNVQLLLGMDLVRALRHIFWKLKIGQAVFPAPTATFVAAFNFIAATAKLWLAAHAGRRAAPETFKVVLPLAAALFALGSAVETGSELQRRAFKKTAPKGAIYTGGLFRHARSINYTGYITWRVGMALATCSPWAALSPAFHAYDFGARAVPMLEQYMSAAYGDQWKTYCTATPYRLLPCVW